MAAGTAMTLETLRVEIRAEIQKYKSDLQKAESTTVASSNRMRTALNAVKTALGAIGIVTGLMAAITKIVQLGKESIELASDLEEVQNVVDVTFGNMSGQIDEFATNAMTQFGLSQTAAKQYASTIGAVLKSMGFNGQQLVDMSTEIAGLAGDLASFYNLDTETAFAKLRSGILGETEPLKQLGINLSQANLEAFALSQGITTAYNAMSEQEKAMLRYQYILSVTSDAQGDFSRTSDGWANQVRIMREQINALKAEIGSGLMEILLPIVRGINWLLSQVIKGIQTLRRFFSRGGGIANVEHGGLDDAVDVTDSLTSAARSASTAVGGIGKAAKAAGKAFTNASFDELHQLSNPNSSSGGGGGGGGAGVFSDLLDDENLFDEGARAAGGFSGAVDEASESVGGFWKWIDKVRKDHEAALQGLEEYRRAYLETGESIGEKIAEWKEEKWAPNYAAAQEGIEAYNQEVRNTWPTVKGKLAPALSNAAGKLKQFVNGSDEAREGLRRYNEAATTGWHDLGVALGILSDDFEETQSKVSDSSLKMTDDMRKLAGDKNLKELGDKVTGIGTKAGASATAVGTAAGNITTHFRDLHTNASKPISDLVSKEGSVGSTMTDAAGTVKSAAIGKTNSVSAYLDTMKTDGSDYVTKLSSTISDKLSSAATDANQSASSIKQSVVDAVGGAKTSVAQQNWVGIGGQIKAGIKSGMEFAQGDLKQWADNIKNQVKREFHINSPSKWASDVIGIGIDEGLLVGMEKGVPILTEATDRIKGTLESGLAMPNLATGIAASFPGLSTGTMAWSSGGNWVEHLATTIAQNMNAGKQDEQQPIVTEVYLDSDVIATAVSRGRRAQNRRYSSVALA